MSASVHVPSTPCNVFIYLVPQCMYCMRLRVLLLVLSVNETATQSKQLRCQVNKEAIVQ